MLKNIGADIWIYDGPELVFAGAPMHTRMTLVKLADGGLWVHSPVAITDAIRELMTSLADNKTQPVSALVAPNKFHHLYIQQWRTEYPQAAVFAEADTQRKVSHLADAQTLSNDAPGLYSADIDQVLFTGNRMFSEAVFYHRASGTLIFTDLMINLRVNRAPLLPKLFLQFEGVVFPDGGIPRLYRWFTANRQEARRALQKVQSWAPRQLTFCHGEGFADSAEVVLKREFAWLER